MHTIFQLNKLCYWLFLSGTRLMLISAMAVFLECHIFILPMLLLRLTRIVLSLGYIFFEIYLFIYVYGSFACMHIRTPCVYLLHTLELGLHVIVRCCVCVENWAQILCKSNKCSCYELSSPVPRIIYKVHFKLSLHYVAQAGLESIALAYLNTGIISVTFRVYLCLFMFRWVGKVLIESCAI